MQECVRAARTGRPTRTGAGRRNRAADRYRVCSGGGEPGATGDISRPQRRRCFTSPTAAGSGSSIPWFRRAGELFGTQPVRVDDSPFQGSTDRVQRTCQPQHYVGAGSAPRRPDEPDHRGNEKMPRHRRRRRRNGRIEVNGLMEVLRCRIDPQLITQNDRELLEDLVTAASTRRSPRENKCTPTRCGN